MRCPNCKTEYQETETVCAECGTDLVEKSEDIKETEQNEEIENIEQNEEFDLVGEQNSNEEDGMEGPESLLYTPAKTYVRKIEAYKDLLYSGVTFVIFGIAGLVYLSLCQLNMLPIRYDIIIASIIGIMFGGFIVFGMVSMIKSRTIKCLIPKEEENTKIVQAWLVQNITKQVVKTWMDQDISDAENDILITAHIRSLLINHFSECEISYLEWMTEEYYTEHFIEEPIET